MKHPDRKESRFPAFKERLRELQGDMSNTTFADFLGMSRQTIGFYLNGDRIPDILGLEQIARKCNVSTDWLLGISDAKAQDGDIRQACNFTGLAEHAVINLNMKKALSGGIENCCIRLINEIASDRGGFSDLVWKSGVSALRASQLTETRSPGEMNAAMVADVVCRQEDIFNGMIKVPAKDAAILYENAAVEYMASIVRDVIQEHNKEYLSLIKDPDEAKNETDS